LQGVLIGFIGVGPDGHQFCHYSGIDNLLGYSRCVSFSKLSSQVTDQQTTVAFVGAVSNVHALCKKFHFLAWICTLKGPVVGIISVRSLPSLSRSAPLTFLQGILPAVLLAVLLMLLPIVLRLLARFQGIPKKTGLELSLMTRFFLFQVVVSRLVLADQTLSDHGCSTLS
jgi:hypothetical protein